MVASVFLLLVCLKFTELRPRKCCTIYIPIFHFRFRVQHVADVGVALVLLLAFSLVGAQGAKELVRERLSEEKRILYLAGVHPITYWVTALIWDFIVSQQCRQ